MFSEIVKSTDWQGKVLEGLVRRRDAEALLFQGEDWSEV